MTPSPTPHLASALLQAPPEHVLGALADLLAVSLNDPTPQLFQWAGVQLGVGECNELAVACRVGQLQGDGGSADWWRAKQTVQSH